MNNLIDSKDDEINLIEIIQLLWKNKITIISTTLVASLFGLILNLNQTKSFDVSIPLEVGKKSAFIKFIPINDILREHGFYVKDNNSNGYSFDAQSILKMLINEFQDKEEIIDRAFAIMRDWTTELLFEPPEIERERKVGLEEYRSGLGVQTRIRKKLLPYIIYI